MNRAKKHQMFRVPRRTGQASVTQMEGSRGYASDETIAGIESMLDSIGVVTGDPKKVVITKMLL